MEAYYERGLKSGLYYLANGAPVAAGGVTYATFVQPFQTTAEVFAYVQQWQGDLPPSEPDHKVYQVLCTAMPEPAHLAAWHSELRLVS